MENRSALSSRGLLHYATQIRSINKGDPIVASSIRCLAFELHFRNSLSACYARKFLLISNKMSCFFPSPIKPTHGDVIPDADNKLNTPYSQDIWDDSVIDPVLLSPECETPHDYRQDGGLPNNKPRNIEDSTVYPGSSVPDGPPSPPPQDVPFNKIVGSPSHLDVIDEAKPDGTSVGTMPNYNVAWPSSFDGYDYVNIQILESPQSSRASTAFWDGDENQRPYKMRLRSRAIEGNAANDTLYTRTRYAIASGRWPVLGNGRTMPVLNGDQKRTGKRKHMECEDKFDNALAPNGTKRMFQCSQAFCCQKFTSKRDCERHMETVHKPPCNECPGCLHLFSRESALKRHLFTTSRASCLLQALEKIRRSRLQVTANKLKQSWRTYNSVFIVEPKIQ